MLEANAVAVPEELDPAEVVSLVLTYMTAYQLLHRTAEVKSGETVLVHGAAGRVGTAVLELGSLAGFACMDLFSSRPRRGRAARRGSDRLPTRTSWPGCASSRERRRCRARRLGGAVSLRSFRALRPGGRLVVFGHSATLVHGHKSWRGWVEWYAATATVGLWGLLSPRRRVSAYRIQKLREGHQLIPVGSRHPLPVGGGPRDRKDSGGLPRVARAASSRRDPPGRGRAHAAHRRAPRTRAARELGGQGKARARALADNGRGRPSRRPYRQRV